MTVAAISPASPNSPIGFQKLETAFADFLNIDIANGDAATDTIATYISQIKQYLNWCAKLKLDPVAVTRREIKEYRRWLVEDKQYKPTTIALKLTAVRRFYDGALEHGLLAVNPAVGVRPPREKRDPAEKITFLEKEEAKAFLAAVAVDGSLKSFRDLALLKIMTLEGPRTIEMHRANVGDVVQQGHNLGIRVEGKRNIRIVPLTPKIAQCLRDYLAARIAEGEELTPASPLFIAVGNRAGGQRISRQSIRRIVDKYLKYLILMG